MAAPTLDGNAHGQHSGGGNATATLTTTKTNDIIVMMVYNELNAGASAVSGVTSPGLTFAKRSSSNGTGNGNLEIWWALSAGILTAAVLTVAFAATYDNASLVAFGVNGCKTAAPWDSNVSLPRKSSQPTTGGTQSVSGVSTTEANDFLIAGLGAVSGPTSTPITGWTFIDLNSNGAGTFFSVVAGNGLGVTSPQSSLTVTGPNTVNAFGAVTAGGEMIVDALTADAAPSKAKGFFHNGFSDNGSIALPSPALAAAMLGIGAIKRNKVITRRALLGKR
jgi:hypothetical protein